MNWRLFFLRHSLKFQVSVAGAGIFLSSYDMGVMAMALVSLKHLWHLNPWQLTLVASITSAGMILGSLSAGIISDRFGRRGILIWDYITFLGAAIISVLSPNIWWLCIARFGVGFGVGADFAITFTYLAEICPPHSRGRTMAWVMWFANFGTVLAYAVGSWFLSTTGYNGWRFILASGVLLAIPLVLLRSLILESPMWEREHIRQKPKDILRQLLQPSSKKSLGVSTTSYFLYQITDQGLGMFLPFILVGLLGQSIGTSTWSSVLVKAVTIPSALVTIFLIDRWGRRPLQIFGFIGRALSLLILGIMILTIPHPPFYFVVGFMMLAYMFGPAGPDKTIVIAPAEQFNTPIRGTGEGLSEMAGRLGGIVGTVGYSMIYAIAGNGGGLLFFGTACAIGSILSIQWLQETRPTIYTKRISNEHNMKM